MHLGFGRNQVQHSFIQSPTPDRWQLKKLLTIDVHGSKIARNTVFFIAICCKLGDKWQSKTMFLTIFDLPSSIVLTFLIAAYTVWFNFFITLTISSLCGIKNSMDPQISWYHQKPPGLVYIFFSKK